MRKRKRTKAGPDTPRRPGVGRIDVKLPSGLVEEIEKLVARRVYMSKADFVRSAVREKLAAGARSSAQGDSTK
jgi:Arc/MetJ-type ribon-helix-helix transcriptional regulator